MSNTINMNGRPMRKTLASQLDRLDGILDTIGEGLNQAVADAVREAVTIAVQQAVEAVLREVLSHPELLRQLASQAQPQTPVQPNKNREPSKLARLCVKAKNKLASGWRWLRDKVVAGCQWFGQKARELPGKIRRSLSNVRIKATSKIRGFFHGLGETAKKAWRLRRAVGASLTVGLVVGGVGYLAGPVVSALALGLSGSAISLTGFLVMPLVRLWRSLKAQAA